MITSVRPDAPRWVRWAHRGWPQYWSGALTLVCMGSVAFWASAGSGWPIGTAALLVSGAVAVMSASVGTAWSAAAVRHRDVRPFAEQRHADIADRMVRELCESGLEPYSCVVYDAASDLSMCGRARPFFMLEQAVSQLTSSAATVDPRVTAAEQMTQDLVEMARRYRESK